MANITYKALDQYIIERTQGKPYFDMRDIRDPQKLGDLLMRLRRENPHHSMSAIVTGMVPSYLVHNYGETQDDYMARVVRVQEARLASR